MIIKIICFFPPFYQGKVKGAHSRKLCFLASTIASRHSAFQLTEVSVSEVPWIQSWKIRLVRSTSEAAILKLSWQPCFSHAIGPTQNWRRGEKFAIDLTSFTRPSAKPIFFSKRFSTSLSSMSSFRSLKHFWLRIICLTSLFENHLDKIFWTELRHENAAWLLSTAQNFGNDIWIVVFFRGEFHRENLHFRGKLRWVAKLSARFLLALTKKYTTFPFTKISPFINMKNKKNSKEEL